MWWLIMRLSDTRVNVFTGRLSRDWIGFQQDVRLVFQGNGYDIRQAGRFLFGCCCLAGGLIPGITQGWIRAFAGIGLRKKLTESFRDQFLRNWKSLVRMVFFFGYWSVGVAVRLDQLLTQNYR